MSPATGYALRVTSPVDAFLSGSPHAVVGASTDRSKYGNKVLRTYLQQGRPVYAVNPREAEGDGIEGVQTVATLADLPEPVHGVSIITPPRVTEQIVDDAIETGIRHLWMQPGAESDDAIARAEAAGVSVIHGGPCLLVVLGFRGP
jgi:predicted CoA-binding protein